MQHDFAPHALDRDAYNLRCRILTGLSVNRHTLDLCHFLNKVLFQRIHMCYLFIKILVDLHAPKGTGFLYIKDKTKIKPIIYGGGQQKGMRSGTENVPGVAALGEASMEIYENFDEKIAHIFSLSIFTINVW